MLKIYYRQKKIHSKIKGELEIVKDELCLFCEADVPNEDIFELCGNWKEALELGIQLMQKKAISLESSSTRSAHSYVIKLAESLKSLLLEPKAAYSEAFEELIIDSKT